MRENLSTGTTYEQEKNSITKKSQQYTAILSNKNYYLSTLKEPSRQNLGQNNSHMGSSRYFSHHHVPDSYTKLTGIYPLTVQIQVEYKSFKRQKQS